MQRLGEGCGYSVIILTETWLGDDVPDGSVSLDNFTLLRKDRTAVETNKIRGVGVCVYVNNRWCNNIALKHASCSVDLEMLCLQCRPFYLPREFNCVIFIVVYIPPSANKLKAEDSITQLYITCPTRDPNTLDLCYCNKKHAYKSKQRLPLGNSDHNMISMQPTYARRLKALKPTIKTIKERQENLTEEVAGSLACTGWSVSWDACSSIHEVTETMSSYINFCIDCIVPDKNIKIYPNNNSWVTKELRTLMANKQMQACIQGKVGAMIPDDPPHLEDDGNHLTLGEEKVRKIFSQVQLNKAAGSDKCKPCWGARNDKHSGFDHHLDRQQSRGYHLQQSEKESFLGFREPHPLKAALCDIRKATQNWLSNAPDRIDPTTGTGGKKERMERTRKRKKHMFSEDAIEHDSSNSVLE
ncbi:hypothetical protein CAPTEDRAFT_202158 [Capitella teleta]|uniref:Uncharacterized protein n=1 Tax=Capitella teleta TaxID=283909 RepID=R7UBW3_CAPTE|nr:hypothetical protein CAPTEDRAFT_202158 [Capitella teleta]|eukprot:ELU00762.1 hypothetical protein CAPTEDRAFT_202158 [Capitella teleta]